MALCELCVQCCTTSHTKARTYARNVFSIHFTKTIFSLYEFGLGMANKKNMKRKLNKQKKTFNNDQAEV